MFSSVLIANRGEIACRIIETANKLNIRAIAVYSAADKAARHVRLADEAHYIGEAEASASYLDMAAILDVAKRAQAQAIHPGYGFLAENADFAQACADAGIVFIGPTPSAIRAMGAKDEAKKLMVEAGVPIVPGYHGKDQELDVLSTAAAEIGFPVLIKAVMGGGGRGMRRADSADEFADALAAAQREAKSAFGDDRVLVEKFIETPRHIEIQVFADGQGNVVHLGERDCSLQRRHQKVIEEAPAPGMSDALRDAMGTAAVKAAQAVKYLGAGTVEFIVPGGGTLDADTPFYFMEMNTRLQVEHPVTELVTGTDLVEWQFRVAAGETLPLAQSDIALKGHALEARLYAENPASGFLPQTGRLLGVAWPEQSNVIRLDRGVDEGDEVSPYYDAMIAKLIATGKTRDGARLALIDALHELKIAGLVTNKDFLVRLLAQDNFAKGDVDTGLIDRELVGLVGEASDYNADVFAALVWLIANHHSVPRVNKKSSGFDRLSGWQLGGGRSDERDVIVNGDMCRVSYDWQGGRLCTISMAEGASLGIGQWHVEGQVINAEIDGSQMSGLWALRGNSLYVDAGVEHYILNARLHDGEGDDAAASGIVRAVMPGKVQALDVVLGQVVTKGARLGVLEAMKMEHALHAAFDGTIVDIRVGVGQQVALGDVLIVLEGVAES